jgi:hypothetical protein
MVSTTDARVDSGKQGCPALAVVGIVGAPRSAALTEVAYPQVPGAGAAERVWRRGLELHVFPRAIQWLSAGVVRGGMRLRQP